MRSLRSLLIHPLSMAVIAVVIGLVTHKVTTYFSQRSAANERVHKNVTTKKEPERYRLAEKGTDLPSRQQKAPEQPTVSKISSPSIDGLKPKPFREVWAYLMAGEEDKWNEAAPITDVGLFNYRISESGKLIGHLNDSTLKLAKKRGARTHLVIASSGQKSLLHFLINPNYRAQGPFLGQILNLVKLHEVDGLQLDFESILPEDRFHLTTFLKELRSSLPDGLIFSLALPAQVSISPKNALNYRALRDTADRYFIMVYDQHWKGGSPGSIASRDWHDRVIDCVLKELPREKVIIGLPFYGRIWQREKVARATRHHELEALIKDNRATVHYNLDKSHHFTFTREITAECWFDDAVTLHQKFASGHRKGVQNIGFWRLGQEDARVWKLITRAK